MAEDPDRWMAQARRELEAAAYNAGGSFHAEASFLAQQAADKALKAIYVVRHARLWKTHDLAALAERVEAPKEVRVDAEAPSPHYVATRYPPEQGTRYDEDVANEALDRARRIVAWVEDEI